MIQTTPFAGGPPSPVNRPRTSSRAFWRSALGTRTEEGNSLTAHVSPLETSKPAVAIRRRASTPASNQVELFCVTQAFQPVQLISASAWTFVPSARILAASPLRSVVLLAARGGTET